MACLCGVLNRLYTLLHVCHSLSVSTEINKEKEEEAEEKKESEFSMLSTIDMCAACYAVSSVDRTGVVEDKQNHLEFLLTVSRFSPCILRVIELSFITMSGIA